MPETLDESRVGERAVEHVRHLAVDIGPRGTTTAGERKALDYALEEMGRWDLEPREEPFQTYWSLSFPWGLISILMIATGVLLWLNPIVAAAVGALNLLVYYPVASGRGDVGRLFPKRPSANVWVRVPAAAGKKARRRVVFMSHADTTRASMPYAPSQLKNLRLSHMGNLISVLGLFILALVAVWATGPGLATAPSAAGVVALVVRILGSVLALIALYALGIFIHRETVMPYVTGANDNASGVGLNLAVGEYLSGHPLSNTEVWCVVTGSEEQGYPAGARRFIDAHREELRDSDIIVLDNIGAGDIRHLTEEGIIMPLKMDRGLLGLAREVGARHPEWKVKDSVCNLGYTDATPAIAAGLRTIALWAEGADGFLVNYHWMTDTFENVDPETVGRAAAFILEMVRGINRGDDRETPPAEE